MISCIYNPRWWRCFGPVLLCLVLLAATVSPYRFQEIYHQNSAAVIRLKITTAHGVNYVSAFLVRADGTMITASYNLRQAVGVEVIAADHRTAPVDILADNRPLGVAALRAPSDGSLPVLRLAKSSALSKDDWVIGIGYNSQGEAEPIAGCVSKIGRLAQKPQPIIYTIDAATPPGGPILNLRGEVVAMAVRPQGSRRCLALAADDFKQFILDASAINPPAALHPKPPKP